MILKPPFEITARLLPGLRVQDQNGIGWIHYDHGQFIIDLPDGTEHLVEDFHPGACSKLEGQFVAILGFLGACAESRHYNERGGMPSIDPDDNSGLFPEAVGTWAQQVSDELASLQYEIEEAKEPLIV